MKRWEAEELKVDDLVLFHEYATVWRVVKIVERGVVLEKSGSDPHRHLCEWVLLAYAVKV